MISKQKLFGWLRRWHRDLTREAFDEITGILNANEMTTAPTDAQIDEFINVLMHLFCVGDMMKTPHTMDSVARELMRNWLATFR